MQNLLTTPAEAKAILAKVIALGFTPTAITMELMEAPWDGPNRLIESLDKQPINERHMYGFTVAPNPDTASEAHNLADVRDQFLDRPNTNPDLKWQMLYAMIYHSWDIGKFSEFKANVPAVKAMVDDYAASVMAGKA